MAWQDYINTVQEIYIAYYQRPGDPAGIRYWAQRLDAAGGNLNDIINAFANSPESQNLYGEITGDTIGDVIDSIYQALFGRAPDAAGKQWYIDEFNAGRLTEGQIALAILNGARNDDLIAIQNKLQVANTFSQLVDGDPLTSENFGVGPFQVTYQGDTDAQQARDMLNGVLANPSTILTADQIREFLQQHIADPGDPMFGGQTFTLTMGVDNIVGTAGNDTIIADNTVNTVLTAADQINGAGGNDTLKIYQSSSTGLENTVFGQLTSVENIYINNGKLTNGETLDISSLSGVTSIELDSPVAMANNESFTLKTASGQAVSLKNVVGTSGGTSTFKLDGASDVTLNGVGTDLTLDLASAGTALKLTATGAASEITLTNSGTKLNTLTLAGDKDLSITEGLTGLTTIDASAASGKVKVDMSGASSDFNLKFTGGSGNDTLVFALGHLTKNDVIDMGAGSGDKVVIKDTTPDYAGINAVKNAEVLALGANATLDIAQITNGINQFAVANTTGAIFNNALSTSTFTIDNSSGVDSVTIANKVGETATSVTIDNQGGGSKTLGTLTLTGATNVTLTSTGKNASDANTIGTFYNADNSNIVVKGNADLTFTVSGTTTGSKVDATNFTGKLNVTSSGKGDILIGGSGDDTFTSKGLDTITGNGGKDTFYVSNAATTNTALVDVTITDIAVGDKIVFVDRGTEVWTKTAVNVSTATTLAGALDIAASSTSAEMNAEIKWFQFGGNTYIVQDLSNSNTFQDGTDIAIKLTGLVDLSGITALGNELVIA